MWALPKIWLRIWDMSGPMICSRLNQAISAFLSNLEFTVDVGLNPKVQSKHACSWWRCHAWKWLNWMWCVGDCEGWYVGYLLDLWMKVVLRSNPNQEDALIPWNGWWSHLKREAYCTVGGEWLWVLNFHTQVQIQSSRKYSNVPVHSRWVYDYLL